MKKAPAKKQKKADRQTVVRWALIVVLVVLGALFVKHRLDVNSDAQNFRAAESRIEEVYEQIEAITGQPDKVVRQQTCVRASRKFETGPLSCFVKTLILFQNRNAENSSKLLKSVSGVNVQPVRPDFLNSHSSLNFIDKDVYEREQVFHQDINNEFGLTCSLMFEYPFGPKSNYYDHQLLNPGSEENLIIIVSCGGPAKAEHYPLRD